MSELLRYVPAHVRDEVAARLETGDIPDAPVEYERPSVPQSRTRQGSRGGTTTTAAEGMSRLDAHRGDEVAALRSAILLHALTNPDVHADDVAHVPVAQRNAVGAAFRGLLDEGQIVKTGERRPSRLAAAHGRSSYVYRATGQGCRTVDWRGLSAVYTDREYAEFQQMKADGLPAEELFALHEIKARFAATLLDGTPVADAEQMGLLPTPEGEEVPD